ncbi:MAG: secretin N-terminal domain-containing protein [Planctomycetota bacterium]
MFQAFLSLSLFFASLHASVAADHGKPAQSAPVASSQSKKEQKSVRFSFVQADWRQVLEWFAEESGANLDWSELPEGKLNLLTQRAYPLEEARNVLNRHLLRRGFTLLRTEHTLFLARLDESLNSILIPRIQPSELAERCAFDYVRTSFQLDWMLAENAVDELKPMLSPHGRMTAMTATNRLEVMDAVVNLRELHRLLSNEQSTEGQQRLVREFPLQHAVATEVLDKLRVLLGLEVTLENMSRDQMRTAREQYEFKAELVKRLGENAPKVHKERVDVFLVADERKNYILANAPPDKIAIIKQAIESLDAPVNEAGFQLADVSTMKVYSMNGLEAKSLEGILDDLQDVGKIHPDARFTSDDDREILIAYASLQDHITIQSVMDRLSASSRSLRIVPLLRLRATYVAESIRKLMGETTESSSRKRRDSSKLRGFHVEPDEPNNRLFLFATDDEARQVEELMVQFGERSTSGERNVRFVNTGTDDIAEILGRVESAWRGTRANPLLISVPGYLERQSVPPQSFDSMPSEGQSEQSGAQKTLTRSISTSYADDSQLRGPPVTIRQGSNGDLVLRSEDPAALDQLESLLRDLVSDERPYKVYQLVHESPGSMQRTIEEILTEGSMELMTPLRFVGNENTKSLLVFGANPSELKRIDAIIESYDQPLQIAPDQERKPQFFRLKYAKAESVAAVIKDVYRDLLSPDDVARQLQDPERSKKQEKDSERVLVSYPIAEEGRPRYKGMLSVGTFVDTNTVVVSSPQYLTGEISEIVKGLDHPEAGEVIRIVKLNSSTPSAFVTSQLREAFESESFSRTSTSNAANRAIRRESRRD